MAEVKRRTNLQIWGDVIFALFIRELRSKFNDKFGLSWAILEPLLFILGLSYGRSLASGGQDVHNMPTFAFMMYGMLLVQLFTQVLNGSATAINRNRPLYAFRQVQPISAVIASILEESLVKIFVYLLCLVFMLFIAIEIELDDVLTLLSSFFLLVTFSGSLGLIFGLAEQYIEEIQKIRQLMVKPLFFISGTFFSLQDFPREYWHYLDWNPILHSIELARTAAHADFGAQGVSLVYLSITSLTTLFIALSCYRVCWKGAISR